MVEIYWLTRLTLISQWITTFAAFFGVFLAINIFMYFVTHVNYVDRENEENKHWYDFWRGLFKVTIPSFLVFLTCSILVPTTKEAYMIYGVGGTIDFLRNDSTAVEIPHKCIEALDGWVESLQLPEKK